MVIDRGAFLSGRYPEVFEEIVAVKQACGDAHLKVILETGELVTYDNVRRASWLAMLAGADFIKTSTGKIQPAATLPVTLVMLEAVRDFRDRHRPQVGVKPAGGIRTAKDAIKYLVAGQRDRRRRLARPRLVPDRRVEPAQRPADAADQDHDRPLLRPRLLHPGLRWFDDWPVRRSTTRPRPSRARSSTSRPSYGLFIGGEFVDPIDGRMFKTVSPATEEVLAEVAEAGQADVDRAVAGRAPRLRPDLVDDARRESARKYLYRIARIVQERARELAVLESLDNGKPIRESRDVDIPLVAAHFFYYAGWADKLEHAGFGPNPQPLGVAGQVIPWNFPLLMLAWKIAPALAGGNTVVLKPAETTPLTALLFAEICQQADLPPGVVNIVTGAGETGRALVEHPGVDKVAFTGSTEVGKMIARSVAGTEARRSRSSSAARPPTSCSTTRRSTRRSRASSTASSSTRATSAAPARGCSCRRASYDEVISTRSSAGSARCASATRWTRTPTSARSTPPSSSARSASCPTSARSEGAERWSPPCELPDRGFWFAPTIFTGVTQAHRIAREEIFGPVLSVLTFRTPAEAVEKANNTPYGLSAGVWTDKGSRILWMANQLRAGVVWANTFNRFDPTSPFGGYKESGYGREGGRHGLEAYLATAQQRGAMSDPRLSVRKTYKLYIGGEFPRSESGRSYEVTDAKGRFLANAALASRKDARDAVRRGPQGVRRLVGRDRLQPRPGPLPRGRAAGGPARPVRRRGRRRARACPPRKAEAAVDAAIDRWVWYAGWADKIAQVLGRPTRSPGPYFDFSMPEPTGVVAVLAPQDSSLLGLVSVLAPVDRHRATPASCWRRGARRCRRSRSPRCWRPPTCPAAWSTCSPAGWPRSRRGSPRTWTSTRSTWSGPTTDTLRRPRGRGGRQPQAGAAARRPADWTRDPGLEPDARLPRDQDGLAPGRRLSARAGNRAGRAHAAVRHLGHALPT